MAPKRLTREESRKQTRDRLVAAAAELFTQRGVNGTSVEQIAERAGYSRGAFYGNFADKGDLVRAVLEQRSRAELDEVRTIGRGADSFPEAMERLREWNRDRGTHLTDWLSLRMELLLHALRHPELRPALAERERLACEAVQEGVEHELARQGERPPADPALLALIVHALEDGLLLQRVLRPGEIRAEVMADAVELLVESWSALSAARASGASRAAE